MQLAQVFQGDLAEKGFLPRPVASPGFPSGVFWIDNMRSPRLCQVTPDLKTARQGLNVASSAYEVQPLNFGELSVVYSAIVFAFNDGVMNGRQHQFTQVVYFPNSKDMTAAECLPIQTLLGFDKFLKPDEFWQSKEYQAPIIDYDCEYRQPQYSNSTQLDNLYKALLCRYWRACSLRMFPLPNETMQPLYIIPEAATTFEETIQRGKELLENTLVPYLPLEARNIISMSAGVRNQDAIRFAPTAMVVLLLSGEADIPSRENIFDLRYGRFIELDALQADFINDTISQLNSKPAPEILELYGCFCGEQQSTASCTFMADYRVRYAVWYLHNRRYNGDGNSAVGMYRTLFNALLTAHRLQLETIDSMLRSLEDHVFCDDLRVGNGLSEENLQFLFQRVARVSDCAAKGQMMLLASHQKLVGDPVFLRVWPLDATNMERMGKVLLEILMQSYMTVDISQTQRDKLGNQGFCDFCHAPGNEPVFDAMRMFLNSFNQEFPSKTIFMMPLSKKYLNPTEIMKCSLQMLDHEYSQNLPDSSICDIIRDSRSYLIGVPDNEELLSQYLLHAYIAHRNNPGELSDMLKQLSIDGTQGLSRILNWETDNVAAQPPLTPEQIHQLLNAFAPVVGDKDTIHADYRSMLKRVLEQSIENADYRYTWLQQVGGIMKLVSDDDVCNISAHYVATYGARHGCAMVHSEVLLLADKALQPDSQNRLKQMLNDQLQSDNSQVAQSLAKNTWGKFGVMPRETTEDGKALYDVLREYGLECARKQLISDFDTTGNYWGSINRGNEYIMPAKFSIDDLDSDDVKNGAKNLLTNITRSLLDPSAYDKVYQDLEKRANYGVFYRWARQTICVEFTQRFNGLFESCTLTSDVSLLERLCDLMHVKSDVQPTDAWQHIQMMHSCNSFIGKPSLVGLCELLDRLKLLRNCAGSQTLCNMLHIMIDKATKNKTINYDNACLLLMVKVCAHRHGCQPIELLSYFQWEVSLIKNPLNPNNLDRLVLINYLLYITEYLDSKLSQSSTPITDAFLHVLVHEGVYAEYTNSLRRMPKKLGRLLPSIRDGDFGDSLRFRNNLERWLVTER